MTTEEIAGFAADTRSRVLVVAPAKHRLSFLLWNIAFALSAKGITGARVDSAEHGDRYPLRIAKSGVIVEGCLPGTRPDGLFDLIALDEECTDLDHRIWAHRTTSTKVVRIPPHDPIFEP